MMFTGIRTVLVHTCDSQASHGRSIPQQSFVASGQQGRTDATALVWKTQTETVHVCVCATFNSTCDKRNLPAHEHHRLTLTHTHTHTDKHGACIACSTRLHTYRSEPVGSTSLTIRMCTYTHTAADLDVRVRKHIQQMSTYIYIYIYIYVLSIEHAYSRN